MPVIPDTFTSPRRERSHGGAQINTQCTKCISSSLSVGRVGWIEKKKKAFGGMHLLLRSLINDLNCLGEILAVFEFHYVLRSTFLGYSLSLSLGDFVRLNRQSGTKTVMRGSRALNLPTHPHVRRLVRLGYCFPSSFCSRYRSAAPP